MRLLIRPPKILRRLYKKSVWRINPVSPTLYLTFDDGPIPELTPWVLDTLKHYNITATFFCVGENLLKYPEIAQRIINEGHLIGNHTFNHLKGWKSKNDTYLNNIEKCNSLTESKLFRPPYGRLKISQYKKLKDNYKIVFWDVLTHDYDKNISKEKCLKNSIKYTRNGSIIVFHDNKKAELKLKYTLPAYIEHFLKLNYKFAVIN